MNIRITQFFISGTIYVTSGLKYPKLVLDKYVFTVTVKYENKTQWTCSRNNSRKHEKRCGARLVTCGKTVHLLNKHNHDPVVDDKELRKMIPQLVTIIRGVQ
ncbi:hypothetical protein WA026_007535 [Henosepilachna vigintioctopunctata]|uniref:FLYWCH-type domain-containing protein n=1 Tax=Henosepilachna vigintioctopunctata TaxID=420089 RepID=A0AAW1UXJ2_9CUCU